MKTPPGNYPLVVTGPEPLSSNDFQFEGEAVCIPMVSSTGHGHASLKRVHYASGRFALANIITAAEVNDSLKCDTKFLYHYLQHFKDDLIVTRMQGTANVSLSQKVLATVPVQLPPLDEQRRIVDLIGSLEAAVKAAEYHVESTYGLLAAVQTDTPPGQRMPLRDVLMGIDSGVSSKPVEGAGPGVHILKVSAVRPARFQPQEIKQVGPAVLPEKARVVEGDLLMTRSNTPDRVGYVCLAREVPKNSFMPDLIWRLRVDESIVLPSYVEHLMSSAEMRRAVTSTASGTSQSMRKINKRGIGLIQVVIPTLEEQSAYVDRCNTVRSVAESGQSHVDSLRILRSELLTALLSGSHAIPESYDDLHPGRAT